LFRQEQQQEQEQQRQVQKQVQELSALLPKEVLQVQKMQRAL